MGSHAQGTAKVRPRRKERMPDNLFLRNGIWWIRYNVAGKKIRTSLHTRSEREAKRLRDGILGKRSRATDKFGLEAQQAAPCKSFAQVVKLWLDARKADDSLGGWCLSRRDQIWLQYRSRVARRHVAGTRPRDR